MLQELLIAKEVLYHVVDYDSKHMDWWVLELQRHSYADVVSISQMMQEVEQHFCKEEEKEEKARIMTTLRYMSSDAWTLSQFVETVGEHKRTEFVATSVIKEWLLDFQKDLNLCCSATVNLYLKIQSLLDDSIAGMVVLDDVMRCIAQPTHDTEEFCNHISMKLCMHHSDSVRSVELLVGVLQLLLQQPSPTVTSNHFVMH